MDFENKLWSTTYLIVPESIRMFVERQEEKDVYGGLGSIWKIGTL